MTKESLRVAVVPNRDGTPLLVNGGAVLRVRRVKPAIKEASYPAATDTWQVETAKGILQIQRILGVSGERDRWILARPRS